MANTRQARWTLGEMSSLSGECTFLTRSAQRAVRRTRPRLVKRCQYAESLSEW